MFLQQEKIEAERLYEIYGDKSILFSVELCRTLGLNQKESHLRFDNLNISGVLISATMRSIVFLGRFDTDQLDKLQERGRSLSIFLTFYEATDKKALPFNIPARFEGAARGKLRTPDMFYIRLSLKRMMPIEMILILGRYLKATRERIFSKERKMETFICFETNKQKAIALNISKETLKLAVDKIPPIHVGNRILCILKTINSDEIFELIGTATHIDHEADDYTLLTLAYSIKDQGPRFDFSFHLLKNLINY